MNVTIRVRRQDPEAEDTTPFWQDYSLEIEDNATVLDALIKIREDMDGTLSLRCSCRSSICGSCAMRINGHAGLACKTQAAMVLQEGDMNRGRACGQYAGHQGPGGQLRPLLGQDYGG